MTVCVCVEITTKWPTNNAKLKVEQRCRIIEQSKPKLLQTVLISGNTQTQPMTKSVLCHSVCLPSSLSVSNVMNRYAHAVPIVHLSSILFWLVVRVLQRNEVLCLRKRAPIHPFASIRLCGFVTLTVADVLASKRRGHQIE